MSGGAGLSFEFTHDTGAILLLRGPADWTHLDCDRYIKLYIERNIGSWVEFANVRLGMELAEEELIFVSGFTKTTAWAEAAFSDGQSRGEIHITGESLIPSSAGEFRVTLSRSTTSSISSRHGPSTRFQTEVDPDTSRDQSVFLNYYKIKTRRFRAPKVLRAAAGTQDYHGEDSNDSQSDPELPIFSKVCVSFINPSDANSLNSTKTYDPVGEYLDYMLQVQ